MSDDTFSWLTSDQIYTRKRASGVSSLEILALPDDLRQLVNQVIRREPVRLETLVEITRQPIDDVRGKIALLTAQGWLETEEIDGETHYRVHLARRRARSLPPGIWQVLEGTWKVQLFRYSDDDVKLDFSRAFQMERFEAGQHIFQEGAWGYTMYLVDAGRVELITRDADGHEVVLARLRPGDILGEVAVLVGERRPATARAVEPVSAWTLHKDDLDRLLAHAPSVGLSIRREIERRAWGLYWGETTSSAGQEPLNPILVVGGGAMELAQTLSDYTGERLLVLDVHSPPLSPPRKRGGSTVSPPQAGEIEGGADTPIEHRPARDLDSKALAAALRRGLKEFNRVILAAPEELHNPLMSLVGEIELVIDLSAQEAPWVIAAARRRWALPAACPNEPDAIRVEIQRFVRRLCGRVVSLALSGGGARALAHIGVLKALKEAQLPIDMIASSGIGAVVAGLYAAGFSVDELTELATRQGQDLNPFDSVRHLRIGARPTLYAGKRARNALKKLVKGRTFAGLRLPLYVVAANLETGQPIVMKRGPLTHAMEASIALAGLVTPAEISDSPIEFLNGQALVDGSLVNPLPADVLAEHGANLIIGVNTVPHPVGSKALPSGERLDSTGIWLRLRDQVSHAAFMDKLHFLDTIITPAVNSFSDTDFDSAAQLIAAGYVATQQEIDFIRALLTPAPVEKN